MKKFNPLVSIVIPVYNGENYLEQAIKSALKQTYKNIEIIVVNDGSTDKTDAIAQKYKNKIVYYKKKNGGVATALNLALDNMKGEYFSWLSHDDLYEKNKIEDQVNYLSTLSDKNIVLYTNYNIINENSELVAVAEKNHDELIEKPEYSLLRGNVNGITMLIPKKAFDVCGHFDVSLRCTQDYDLWRRIQRKFKFVHLPIVTASTRIHSMQDSQISPKAVSEGNKLWIEMLEDPDDNRKEELEGSVYNYYLKSAQFLESTPYDKATEYANKMKDLLMNKVLLNRKDILVSVIIPFYNRIDLLIDSIKSVMKSSFLNYEILLIDDCSTDDISRLTEFIKENKKVKYYKNKNNMGPSYSRNVGIENAKGDYIAFLDSDDEFMPNKIMIQLSEMLLNNAKVSYTDYYAVSAEEVNEVCSYTTNNSNHNEFIDNCKIATPTIMIKRDFLINNNIKYNTDIKVCEDACFYLELLKKTDFLYIDRFLTKVNISSSSHINDKNKRRQGVINLLNYVLNDDIYCNNYLEIYYLILGYINGFNPHFMGLGQKYEKQLNDEITAKDKEIEAYKKDIKKLNTTIVEKDNIISQLNSAINSIYSSRSMKITKPLRKIGVIVHRGEK